MLDSAEANAEQFERHVPARAAPKPYTTNLLEVRTHNHWVEQRRALYAHEVPNGPPDMCWVRTLTIPGA